jgi:hypothetical protein
MKLIYIKLYINFSVSTDLVEIRVTSVDEDVTETPR